MATLLESPVSPQLESEASFQLLFHQHPLPMWVVDATSLAFVAVNDAALKKYGYSREEFFQMTMDQIATPMEDAGEASDDLKHGASTAWQHKRKDGATLFVESTWHEIPFGGRDAVLVLTLDRTEQRRAERRNREQANLLNLASDAIIVRDLDNNVLFWNQGAERLYGWTTEEMIGTKTLETFVKERHYEAEIELLKIGFWIGQLNHQSKDGRTIIVNSRWTLVRDDDGNPKSVLVIDTDVTETKKLESQFLRAQRLEGIGTLASGIAHDLNNILSPILMSCGILRKEFEDEDTLKMLSIIEGSAERGAGIVKQVLTFARGVEGERVLLQLKHLVSELAKVMAQTFPRNIDIQTHFPPDLWIVMGDATQLHQVLLNLCVNARDAMPQGGSIRLGAENVDIDAHFASMNPGAQLGPHVVLRASDTGSGMSPETMEKIFDPFFTTKEVGKGTGLGLATVIGIVKSHGGFLTVQSELGVGTTFSVFLPASQEKKTGDTAKEEVPIERGNGELVLVVDDEPPIREALVRTLSANGYRAYTAEDGSDALALYFQRRAEIKLVITDLAMGQMDGVTLVRSLRKVDPKVRVIVSSGHMQKENVVILEGMGVKTFLDKPYTAEKLLRAVQKVLKQPEEEPEVVR
ncbi:MAG: PAS domain S-box protein [Chthoniobacter sp.]|uniref:hybrid sensor histidine kinase/response regulator n=1 Tax=Chthoniobacter sp. TaxID=2510640 RepID=UPI0032AB3BE8